MVNLFEIVDRIKKLKRFPSDKDFAPILGISAPDFSKRKKSGTLLPLLIDWGIAEKVNFDWLLRGEGSPYKKGVDDIDEKALDEDPGVAELLTMTSEIVRSETEYALSLSANIRSLHRAINLERKIQDHEKRIAQMEHNKKEILERVRKNDPSRTPNSIDRRNGQDRRKTGTTG